MHTSYKIFVFNWQGFHENEAVLAVKTSSVRCQDWDVFKGLDVSLQNTYYTCMHVNINIDTVFNYIFYLKRQGQDLCVSARSKLRQAFDALGRSILVFKFEKWRSSWTTSTQFLQPLMKKLPELYLESKADNNRKIVRKSISKISLYMVSYSSDPKRT